MAEIKQTHSDIAIIPAVWIMFFVIAYILDRTGVVIAVFAMVGVVSCIVLTIAYLEREAFYGKNNDAKD